MTNARRKVPQLAELPAAELLQGYLKATGLTATAVAEALRWESDLTLIGPETLPPEDVEAYHEAQRRLMERGADPAATYPGADADEATIGRVTDLAQSETLRLREPRVRALLTSTDGVTHPGPWDWEGLAGARWWDLELAFERFAREEAERQLAAERLARGRRRSTRAGTGFLRSFFTDHDDVTSETRARLDAVTAASANLNPAQLAQLELSPETLEAREMYAPDQLDTYELLVSVGLATIAHERGLVDGHYWAIRGNRPIAGTPIDRIAIPYTGTTEIARALGERNPERATRSNLEDGLKRLCKDDRPIPVPVRVKLPTGQYVDDIEVTWTKWVEVSGTVLTRHGFLYLHPIAVATQARSFVPLDDLLPRLLAARDAIGGERLRDEWARADLYLRWIAGNMACGGRLGAAKLAAVTGSEPAVTVGELTLTRDVTEEKLWTRTGLIRQRRKLGPAGLRERLEMALAFCVEMGSLLAWRRDSTGKYWLTLPHPDRSSHDPDQTLLLAEAVNG